MEKIKKGGFLYLIKIAYRNIFRNLRRSILCIIAVLLAVFLIIFMMSYIEGMISSAKRITQTFETGHIKMTTKGFEDKKDFLPVQYPIDNYEEYMDEIKKIDGVTHVTSRILSYGTFTSSKVKHGFIGGIDFEEIENAAADKSVKNKYAYYNYTLKSNGIIKGRFPKNNKSECIIGYRLAKKMEIIPAIIEKNEFVWIISNLNNEKDKTIIKESYSYDNSKDIFKLKLFEYENWKIKNGEQKISKEELKKIQNESKKSYLELLDIFMNIKIVSLPEKLGKSANIFDYIFEKQYRKNEFESIYKYNEENNTYVLNNNISSEDKEYFLKIFQNAVIIRIPFKILSSQYSDKYLRPKLVGIFDYDYVLVDDNFVLIPFKKMQKLANLSEKTQSIYVYVDNINQAPEVKDKIIAKINGDKNSDLILKDWTEFPFIAMFRQAQIIYVIVYAIFIIMASFLIINTVIMVIHERIKEIGMMGAIGMSRAEIIKVFFLEAVFLSLFGAFFGTLFGGIVTGITSQLPIRLETLTGGVEFPVSSTIFIIFSPKILLQGFLFGTLLTSFCTIFPSLKSAFIAPVEALRR